ncbi:hypothetical protein [Spirulina sp. 06S082]|uniref:hypothetical protein n=1 Tax=Spirulina sp. 06S082 TaxID=3110248 RepID=UPI002B20F109|nr:hypothetical protein [Spirulina sp. 06S082]MEA5472206.1 hypothetical protein [Spirulina sp. 06S082]
MIAMQNTFSIIKIGAIALSVLFITPSALADAAIDAQTCTYRGKKLSGKVQIVENFPDFKVKVVTSFADLKVKTVTSFPDDCGEWQFVEHFPDFKIKFVDSFPDLEIEFVESFPGID